MPDVFTRFRQAIAEVDDRELDYAVAKTQSEERYTLGVLYVPGARDADNEFIDADELQKACWDYVRKGYRRIRDTHTQQEIGELVELISWPYEVTVEASTGDGTVHKYTLPKGSVFAGVIWDEVVWPLVKSGKVRGYSLGGRAVRMKEAATDDAMPRMRDLLARDEKRADAPQPIEELDRIALVDEHLALGAEGTVIKEKVDADTGAYVYDVELDDGTVLEDVRQFSLRKLNVIVKDGTIPNKPGKTNWVEEAGGLPHYIKQIAEDLVDKHGVSGAIRLAVGIVKRWCRGAGNVTAKTRAKACKAVAEWEAKRARAHATKSFTVETLLLETLEKGQDPTDEELDAAEAELRPETISSILDDSASEAE